MKEKLLKIQIRISEYDKNKIKMIADKFADGNVSAWLIYGAINVDRKYIGKKRDKKCPPSCGGGII
jgi:hypothetical protein